MPTARGLVARPDAGGRTGAQVNAFATGLKHPRWIHVLPNGDVLAAEALTLAGRHPLACSTTPCCSTMKRAAAVGASPNRITLPARRRRRRRGRDRAKPSSIGLNQPFGMALLGDTFYVGNTDGVVAFPYDAGDTPHHRAGPQARRPSSPAATGRAACCPAPTARKLYVGVGSLTNIGDHGMAAEEGRAAI